MARVLVIDDDAGTLFGYKNVLRLGGHDVATAALGEDGVAAAQRDQFDVVLCDQRLPDIQGVEVVHRIHSNSPRTKIVLITAWSTPELIIEAKRSGATRFANKPLIGDELLRVIDDALQHGLAAGSDDGTIGYAERRWADLIARGAFLPDDAKTVAVWSRGIAFSVSTLKKRCEAVTVSTKTSHDLVRLLRVVIHHAGESWDLQRRLDIIDARTAEALLDRAGFRPATSNVPTLEEFLSRQKLIVRMDLMDALRDRLLHTTIHLA